MALVKYNNNSISAVTAASSIPSGAMTLIKTLTASADATLSFVHGTADVVLDSTYPIYQFEFINIHAGTNGTNFTFQASTDGGSNYNTAMTTTAIDSYHFENDATTNLQYSAGNDQAQGTSFQYITSVMGDDNDDNMSGSLSLYNPSSTTFVKHYIQNINQTYSTSQPLSLQELFAGYFNTTSAINAIQFKMSSGNIDSGKIKLYGIKDS